MGPAAPDTPDRTEAGPPSRHAALPAYLRLLWNQAPALWPAAGDAGEPAAPHLSDAGLHLPPPPSRETGTGAARWLRAAAAHATAHLVYSARAAQDPALHPLTRALVGLLEDARVEWLAARELPGLRRLWLGFHTADAHAGDDAVSLMARLARALLDPGYADPSPWVAKGRQLFFVDAQGLAIALRQPRELRYAASLLGHDLGQMRLQFNGRAYRPQPDYRDDNRWLWQPDGSATEAACTVVTADLPPQAATGRADAPGSPGTAMREEPGGAAPQDGTPARCYPEWDRLIARHRLRWCSVFERPVAARPAVHAPSSKPSSRPPPGEARRAGWLRRQPSGDQLDLQPAIEQAVLRRAGLAWHEDDRVWARRRRRRDPAHVLVLLDVSASTAEPAWPGGPSLLALGTQAVERAVGLLQAAGDRCAVHGFCSDGRHQVVHWRVLDFGEPMGAAALDRLAALRSGLSTRLGAALRHGVARLLAQPARRRVLLLVSDGRAHDVDVHDPRYLAEDAWQAVRQARRQGVQVLGLDPAGKGGAPLRRLLNRQVHTLKGVQDVHQAVRGVQR